MLVVGFHFVADDGSEPNQTNFYQVRNGLLHRYHYTPLPLWERVAKSSEAR